MFAATVDYNEGEKRTDRDGDKEMVWVNIVNTDIYKTVATSTAYQETNDLEVLSDPQRQLGILGEYAAGDIELVGD